MGLNKRPSRTGKCYQHWGRPLLAGGVGRASGIEYSILYTMLLGFPYVEIMLHVPLGPYRFAIPAVSACRLPTAWTDQPILTSSDADYHPGVRAGFLTLLVFDSAFALSRLPCVSLVHLESGYGVEANQELEMLLQLG